MDNWNGKGEEGGRGEKEASTTGREAERRHVSAARPCTRHSEVAHHRADTADGQRDDDTDKYVEGVQYGAWKSKRVPSDETHALTARKREGDPSEETRLSVGVSVDERELDISYCSLLTPPSTVAPTGRDAPRCVWPKSSGNRRLHERLLNSSVVIIVMAADHGFIWGWRTKGWNRMQRSRGRGQGQEEEEGQAGAHRCPHAPLPPSAVQLVTGRSPGRSATHLSTYMSADGRPGRTDRVSDGDGDPAILILPPSCHRCC